ncbi:MAG: hypothetical protein B5M53_05810 [Candidatus Cloacimonas sp. 4484_209]|nr:MAG: hypothetical protein B5M53_05810 [Candidatus Cloacimonas sp. 4484_209]
MKKFIFLLFTIIFILSYQILLKAKTIEDLDPEYSIGELQQSFPLIWERQWDETVTGFRIRGASFDLHTLHILQHWKGQFPFNNYILFCLNYFTDADEKNQFYAREFELKLKTNGKHYISIFGYPNYDKKQSDVGIRLSYEENPLDFVKFSILWENAPNNYTFKGRDQDSMRIYSRIPVMLSLDISIIKKQNNRMIISFNIEKPYKAQYENKSGNILNIVKGQKSNILIKHFYLFSDSTLLLWKTNFSFNKKNFLSAVSILDSTVQYCRLKSELAFYKKLNHSISLILRLNSDLEERYPEVGVMRKSFLIGLAKKFHLQSKVGLDYCHGNTNKITEDKKRKDNRLILSAYHKFVNKTMVGMNLGIELDSKDVKNTWLGRYDKLFLFIQYPVN